MYNYDLNSKKDMEDFFRLEVLSGSEARELLDVSKQRISQLLQEGRLVPIKKLGRDNLFLKQHVLLLKEELEKNRKKQGTKK